MAIGDNCDKEMIREELQKRLSRLIQELESVQIADACYEIRDYVECPPDGSSNAEETTVFLHSYKIHVQLSGKSLDE